jgi:hypothetical protein
MAKNKFLLNVLRKIALSEPSPMIFEKIEQFAIKLGMDEKELMKLYIELKNKLHRKRFVKTDYSNRILLLPQCLRSKDCEAELGEYGYVCKDCGRCHIPEIKGFAEELGYKVFILPGGGVVEKIIKAFKPKAVLGVACLKELVLGSIVCEKIKIPAQGVALLRDGCVEADVHWSEVREALSLS